MRYAKSLLYGGMLVDAEKANYQDYARLLLRCPFCSNPVFLVKGKHRDGHVRITPKSKQLVTVKASEVKPAFSHFSGVVSEKCEVKCLSVSKKDINRSINAGRNQRLKFFQNRFINIILDGFSQIAESDTFAYQASKANPELATFKGFHLIEIEKDLRHSFADLFVKHKDESKLCADTIAQQMKQCPEEIVISRSLEDKEEALAWLCSLEIDLHLQIVYEAIEFLCTKSAKPVLDRLFDFGFAAYKQASVHNQPEDKFTQVFSLDVNNYRELENKYHTIITSITYGTIVVLCGTRWADAIQESSQFQEAKK